MKSGFPVPAAPVAVEEVITRSRFLTFIERVQTDAEAKALQQRLKQAHPDASHHCLAFVAGPPGDTLKIGASDDGEPAGSAGRPMLNVLLGSGVGQLAAVSVRYYGGTKLGVGGLVRAYAGGVKLALVELATEPFKPMVEAVLACDYPDLPLVEHLLGRHQGESLHQDFGAEVTWRLRLPEDEYPLFAQALQQQSAGRLQPDLIR